MKIYILSNTKNPFVVSYRNSSIPHVKHSLAIEHFLLSWTKTTTLITDNCGGGTRTLGPYLTGYRIQNKSVTHGSNSYSCNYPNNKNNHKSK